MVTRSTVKLTVDLDMKTALRLARFEVESGVGLDQLLTQAVAEWEKVHPLGSNVSVDPRIPVHFSYSPRRRPAEKRTTRGLYDVDQDVLEITDTDLVDLKGRRGTPSHMAMEVVRSISPDVVPNRNGRRDWRETASGRSIGDLRP